MPKHSEQPIYEFGDFRLDAAHLMLYRSGREVPLPPKAIETLRALVERRGEILSKDELMEIIWTDSIVEESNLSQYLYLLRKTLGETASSKPVIETLRRRGYRFTADVFCIKPAPEKHSVDESSGKNVLSLDSSAPLVGREKQIAEIIALLKRGGDTRLLTLTGIGGVGKTTLARIVARRLQNDFSDGVVFIELAAITNLEFVASAIASSIGVKETGDKPILRALRDYLQEREMLLIVDNFEQVVDAAPQIAELVAAADHLKILITSRVLLRLSAEHEFVVPPLALPSGNLFGNSPHTLTGKNNLSAGIDNSALLNELAAYEAIQLFIVRARNTKPKFALTDENANDVAEICARLDGLPLAIELAAARIKLMSPKAILNRLESQLKLLTGGARDLPARQRTMRGTVEWSYDLLEEDEKVLFRRLSVFAGGFTLDAAEAVVSSQWSVVNKQANKHEGSMTTRQTAEIKDSQPTNNYRSLTTDVIDLITSLIDKSLLVSKEQTNGDARFRMLEVVREFALESLEASGEWETMRHRHAAYFLALGEEAEPHLQAAQSSEWLNRVEEEHDNLRIALRWSINNETRLGQRLVGAIWRFWWLHGHIREGCEYLSAFLSQEDNAPNKKTRTKMLLGAGYLNRLRGNFESARSFAEEGLALAQTTGDKKGAAFSLYQIGLLALDEENFIQAGRFFEEGLLFAEDSGDKQILGLLYNGLGEFSRSGENYEQAADFYRQALAINREIGDLARQATNLINLGATALAQKDLPAACSFYRNGLQISSKMADMPATLYCLEGIAGAFWAVREPERAALLFGAAEATRAANNLSIEPSDRLLYDQSIRLVCDSLPEKAYADFFAKGRKIKLDEAVALAQEEKRVGELI